jgi:hypothetical protein
MEEQADLMLDTEQSERPVERLLAAPPIDTLSTVFGLLERVALDPCADVEKLKGVIAMYERLKAKEAELAYNSAKGRILRKLARIKIVKNRSALYQIEKGKPSKGTSFKYAPLEEIHKHLRPLLVEAIMDLSYSNEPPEDGGILIRGRLKQLPSGHFEAHRVLAQHLAHPEQRSVHPIAAQRRDMGVAPMTRQNRQQHGAKQIALARGIRARERQWAVRYPAIKQPALLSGTR